MEEEMENWKERKEKFMKRKNNNEMEKLVENLKTMLGEIETTTKKEERIINLIKRTLDKHRIKYQSNPNVKKIIAARFGIDDKYFIIRFIVQGDKIDLRLEFPFRVQYSSIPIAATYIADINKENEFSIINLDPDDGEITIDYSTLCINPEKYDDEEIWIYVVALICAGRDLYTKLNDLAVGNIPKELNESYLNQFEKSISVLKGEDEEEIE